MKTVFKPLKLAVLLATRLMNYIRLTSLGVRLPIMVGGWSVGYDDLVIIERELRRFIQKRTIRILEFGSGLSTIAIISMLNIIFRDNYHFISVEAEKDWHKKISALVKGRATDENSVIIAEGRYIPSQSGHQFDLDSLSYNYSEKPFDVILVDAPPDINGEDIRLELCTKLLPLLHEKGVLILHDTNRINEMFAYSVLSERFRMAYRYETEKGISLLRFPRRVCQ